MLSNVFRAWPLVAAATVAISGCAGVQDIAGIPHAGHQQDGTYVLNNSEEGMPCRQIKERLDILSRQIKTLPQQAAIEEKSRPQTVGAVFGRMFGGPGDGLQATQDFQRATAESEALNSLLERKQCA